MKKGLCIFLLFIISFPVFSQLRLNSDYELSPLSVSLAPYNSPIWGDGFTITWSRVEGATGYEIVLYKNEYRSPPDRTSWTSDIVAASYTENSGSTTSYIFTGINQNPRYTTIYRAKVRTISNNKISASMSSNSHSFTGTYNNSSSSSSSGGPRLNNSSSRNPFLGTWEGTYGTNKYEYEFRTNTVTVTVRGILSSRTTSTNTYSCRYNNDDVATWDSGGAVSDNAVLEGNKITVYTGSGFEYRKIDCYKQ